MEEAARFRGFHSRVGRQKSDGVSRSLGDPHFKRKTRNSSFKPQSKGTDQDKTAGKMEMMAYNPVRKTLP